MRATKLLVISLGLVLFQISLLCQASRAQFVHPGGLHTQADLDRMRAEVAAGAHPWIDDWNLLVKDPLAQYTYVPSPRANMGVSRQRADQDAHAAYLNAIRWYISGDTRYADCAARILNAWAAAVKQAPTGTDIPGLIGIPIQDFALAGEVLRVYPGWSEANITAFKQMFSTYLYPVVNNFLTNHNNACISHYWANWDAANVGALIAMGVFNDNIGWFNQGVDYFRSGPGNGSIMNAVYHLWPGGLGQWQEAGRDQEHDQLGIGLLGYAAQTAWNQGVDLFGYSDGRLLAGAEYTARYNTTFSAPYTTYNNCDSVNQYYISTNGAGRLDDRPVWELIYNHYHVLEGLAAPNSKRMAELMRPEHGSADHFGYGTLTFTLRSTESPYPPSPAPESPTRVTATPGIGQVFLQWRPVRSANGYNIMRAVDSGNYTKIASLTQTTWPQFTDTSVTNGTMYSYEIESVNQSGASAESIAASATPAEAGALPDGWNDVDLGPVKTPGSAEYAAAANRTFLVTGQGNGIGGTTDSFNFADMQVKGDFTLTTRLTGVSGRDLNRTGLMMRETLDSGSPAVAMILGTTGWRIAQMGTRSAEGNSTRWITGNQYTTMPVWLRLERSGDRFTGYQSSDGVTWFTVATSTVPMAATYYAGLAASSGDTKTGTVETSTFDNTGSVCRIPNGPLSDRQRLQGVDSLQSCAFPNEHEGGGKRHP